jgi:hypothetical protein
LEGDLQERLRVSGVGERGRGPRYQKTFRGKECGAQRALKTGGDDSAAQRDIYMLMLHIFMHKMKIYALTV